MVALDFIGAGRLCGNHWLEKAVEPRLVRICFLERLNWTALEAFTEDYRQRGRISQRGHGAVPKGRPESSPGRQSWVGLTNESSPEGTAELIAHIFQPSPRGLFSILSNVYQD